MKIGRCEFFLTIFNDNSFYRWIFFQQSSVLEFFVKFAFFPLKRETLFRFANEKIFQLAFVASYGSPFAQPQTMSISSSNNTTRQNVSLGVLRVQHIWIIPRHIHAFIRLTCIFADVRINVELFEKDWKFSKKINCSDNEFAKLVAFCWRYSVIMASISPRYVINLYFIIWKFMQSLRLICKCIHPYGEKLVLFFVSYASHFLPYLDF